MKKKLIFLFLFGMFLISFVSASCSFELSYLQKYWYDEPNPLFHITSSPSGVHFVTIDSVGNVYSTGDATTPEPFVFNVGAHGGWPMLWKFDKPGYKSCEFYLYEDDRQDYDVLELFVILESDPYYYDVYGCMDSSAINYYSFATLDDGSCEYEKEEYFDGNGFVDLSFWDKFINWLKNLFGGLF